MNFLLCYVFFILSLPISLSLSLLLSPHLPPLFLFLLYCTYVSTQPKILSNSKASSSRLKGGARSGASFHDLDQRVFPYSPFFHRIIHILLHNKILLCYRLRSGCNVVHLSSTEFLERSVLIHFIRLMFQILSTSHLIYNTLTQLWDKIKFKHHVPMETSQTFGHLLSGIKYSDTKRFMSKRRCILKAHSL